MMVPNSLIFIFSILWMIIKALFILNWSINIFSKHSVVSAIVINKNKLRRLNNMCIYTISSLFLNGKCSRYSSIHTHSKAKRVKLMRNYFLIHTSCNEVINSMKRFWMFFFQLKISMTICDDDAGNFY